MKILTTEGSALLASLNENIICLKMMDGLDEAKESKTLSHSKQLIDTVYQIFDFLLKNNDSNFFSQAAKSSTLKELLGQLDQGKGSYVPEVFNTQSHLLAKKILETLSQFDPAKHLEKTIYSALEKLVGDPVKFIKILLDTLRLRIKFYEILVARKSSKESEFKEAYQHFFKKTDSDLALLLSESAGKSIYEFERLFKKFEAQYMSGVDQLVKLLAQVPYSNFEHKETHETISIEESKPYSLAALVARGGRGVGVSQLIALEQGLNQTIRKHDFPFFLSHVYEHFLRFFSKDGHTELRQRFQTLSNEFKTKASSYETGKHLGMFQKLNPHKKNLTSDLIKFVDLKIKEEARALYPSAAMHSFDISTEMLRVNSVNQQVSQEQKISPGELSKILDLYAERFFMFSVCEINETNDSAVLCQLQEYQKKFGLLRVEERVMSAGPF